MARSGQVDLRVEVFGNDAVEFCLHRPGADATAASHRSRLSSFALWCLSLVSVYTWRAWHWRNAGYVACATTLLALLLFHSSGAAIIEESVLVVPSLGVKLIRKRRNGSRTVKVRSYDSSFIDRSDICAVVVNEAITFSDVVYSVAFMVEDQASMVLAFETFRPRVAVVQQIFRELKTMLFPNGTKMRLPSSLVSPASS
ncbi:Phosphatidylinositol n-acetylglucosaminyltransferase subunit h, partial [Globisporangium splendens]